MRWLGLFTNNTFRKQLKLIFPHRELSSAYCQWQFFIRILSSKFFHLHFSIYIFPSAFLHLYFSIRIFPSAFYHPHFINRIFPSAFGHPLFSIRIVSSAFFYLPSAIRSALYRDPFVGYLNYSLAAKIFYRSLVDGAQGDSMTNPFVICKTNLLQEKNKHVICRPRVGS